MLTWQKLILYPAAIYAVVFLFISALIGFKINQTASWVMVATTLISVVGLYIASISAKIETMKTAVILGLVWVVVMVILDLLLTLPFAGWGYFRSWVTYLNYILVFVIPVVVSFMKK